MVTPRKRKTKRKPTYKSAESRARQLAGLANVRVEDYVHGVTIEKTNGKGLFAGVTEENRKKILELYCQGHSCRYIADQVGVSYNTVDKIKMYYLDYDSQFRNAYFSVNLKAKMQGLIEGAASRVADLLPEMNARDSTLALGVVMDKYIELEREKAKVPEQLHQHVHLHANSEIADQFMQALRG
jgi:hypothetical protein